MVNITIIQIGVKTRNPLAKNNEFSLDNENVLTPINIHNELPVTVMRHNISDCNTNSSINSF